MSSALLTFAVGTNWLIDPYKIYPTSPAIQGLNVDKYAVGRNIRLYLASDILNKRFDVLVLGASTAEGFPLLHPYYQSDDVYRLAIAGANSYEMQRYFQHALTTNTLKRVIILGDFYSFNAYRLPTSDFREDILNVTVTGEPNPLAAWERLANIFSIDTLLDSIHTISSQRAQSDINSTGKIIVDSIKSHTPQREKMYNIDRYHLERGYLPPPYKAFSFSRADGQPSSLDHIRTIVRMAREQGAKVDFIISPSHARALGVIHAAGIWPIYEQWKRALTQMAVEHGNMVVWDFSGFHQYALDRVPDPGERSEMKWYRDQIHFRESIGVKILDRLNGSPTDFGARLSPDILEEHLRSIRQGYENWKKAFPLDASEIDSIAQTAGIVPTEIQPTPAPKSGPRD